MTTASARARRRAGLTLARLDLDRLALPALAVAALASGLLLFHLTRDTSFWADDWAWIAGRRGDTINTFLSPYNGHLSLVPIAIYRLLFTSFGLGSYTPYRTLVICLSVGVAALVFAYARTRVGGLLALLLAALMLFLGPGWQDTMWGFQIAWLIVAGAGMAALMLLDRRRPGCDIAACALIVLAICSTSLSIAFLIGIAFEIAWTRRRWRDGWIVAIPLALYLIWALHYHPSQVDLTAISGIPLNATKAGAAALSGLTGLSGLSTFDQTGTTLTYGVPLLVLAALLVTRQGLHGRIHARTVTLLITLVVFTASVTVAHDGIASILSSRYVYVYCLLATLLVAELARGVRPGRPVQLALCLIAALAIVSNIGALRTFGNYLRQSGEQTNGALGALELDRGHVGPDTLARIALYPFIRLTAGSYFAATDALGTPAFTAEQIVHADAAAQSTADAQLIGDGTVVLRAPGGAGGAGGAGEVAARPPTVDGAAEGAATQAGHCVRFQPSAAISPGATGTVVVTVAAGPAAVSVAAGGAPVTASIRRFAPAFITLGTIRANATAVVSVRHDAAAEPWHLQLQSLSPLRVCTLPSS